MANVAYWLKAVYDKDTDGNQVKKTAIQVEKRAKTRFDFSPSTGVTKREWSVTLESINKVAQKIEAGDNIIFENHKFVVVTTEQIPNDLGYNTFSTLIMLK
jgi:hypothetical protein